MSICRLFLFGFVMACALNLSGPGALAHSEQKLTTPEDGAVLPTGPETIRITFDGPIRVTLIRLTDVDGVEHHLTRSDGMAQVTEIEAVPGALEPGAYTVEWRGLSADGHPMQGSFSFVVSD